MFTYSNTGGNKKLYISIGIGIVVLLFVLIKYFSSQPSTDMRKLMKIESDLTLPKPKQRIIKDSGYDSGGRNGPMNGPSVFYRSIWLNYDNDTVITDINSKLSTLGWKQVVQNTDSKATSAEVYFINTDRSACIRTHPAQDSLVASITIADITDSICQKIQ